MKHIVGRLHISKIREDLILIPGKGPNIDPRETPHTTFMISFISKEDKNEKRHYFSVFLLDW